MKATKKNFQEIKGVVEEEEVLLNSNIKSAISKFRIFPRQKKKCKLRKTKKGKNLFSNLADTPDSVQD